MNRVGRTKEWRVVSQDNSSKGSLFVPRSTLSTHREEPEDDRSPGLDSSSVEDAQTVSSQRAANFENQDFNLESSQQNSASMSKKSACNPLSGNTGDAVADHSNISLSKNLSRDVVKPSDLNSWTPNSVNSPLKSTITNDILASPLSGSSCSGSKASMTTFQQEKLSVDIEAGNGVPISGAVVTDLATLDSNMKNLKFGRTYILIC